MRKSEFKPLSFSTTLRNPSRIISFLEVLASFDGERLTNDVVEKVVFELIQKRIYQPLFSQRNFSQKDELSENDVFEIIKNSPQNHKERGFEKGWQSRFDTWYKFIMELGFCFYEMNSEICITRSGRLLLNSAENESKVANIFLNAFVKQQTNNPFRRVKNANIPLVLLLNVMKTLKERTGESKISLGEIPLFLCWRDDDSVALADEILKFRSMYGFDVPTEMIYERCLELLDSTNEVRFKKSQICGESADEYVRKMRTTSLISLRGNGRFIDFNTLKKEKIDYILRQNFKPKEFSSRLEYNVFLSNIDSKIIEEKTEIVFADENKLKEQALEKFAKNYTKEQIFNELLVLKNKNANSKDVVFKFIPEPTRFEFLTAIALKQNLLNVKVLPNYKIDDEGILVSHATGNEADIVCVDMQNLAIVEVSLMSGKNQLIHEMLPITRHLKARLKESDFAIFVAPKIFEDCKRYAKFIKYDENLTILNFNIDEFMSVLKAAKSVGELNV